MQRRGKLILIAQQKEAKSQVYVDVELCGVVYI